jgi:NADH-quinone oxidoreductase subunit N
MNLEATLTGVFQFMIPEIVLGFAACVLFLGATIRANRNLWAAFSLVALLGAGLALWQFRPPLPELEEKFAATLTLDRLAYFIKVIALAGTAVLVLFSWKEVPDSQAGEYYACLLLIAAGLCLTGAANELITLFLALELISIPTYIILYLPRHDRPAQEAAMKYFLLSIFSSALLLFGFSYLYGLTGTTNLPAIVKTLTDAGQAQAEGIPGVSLIALVMIVAGLGFRITAVPFHFYAPDVYQGAPTVVAALLAFVPKVAGFVALMRVLGFVFAGDAGTGLALSPEVPTLFYFLAIATMTLGNVFGLLQDNIKRLLAYSSVAHAGYMLIGISVAPDLRRAGNWMVTGAEGPGAGGGIDAVLFYLVAYSAMTIGAFAVLSYLSTQQRPVEHIDDLAGVSSSHPGVALVMMLFLFSLIGMPFTAGFFGKFFLFFGALNAQPPSPWLYRILALVGVINAAIGAVYYLRVIAVMYLRTPVKPLERVRSLPGLATLWICALVTLGFGIAPQYLSVITHDAVLPTPAGQPPEAMRVEHGSPGT